MIKCDHCPVKEGECLSSLIPMFCQWAESGQHLRHIVDRSRLGLSPRPPRSPSEARAHAAKPRGSLADAIQARRACIPCNARRERWEDLTWLQRWADAGTDPAADFARLISPVPAGVADAGDGVFLTDCNHCAANLAAFDLSIHIWKPENLTTGGACPRVHAGSGPGLAIEYEEGASLGTMRPPLAEVVSYLQRPGRVLIHCAGGRHRSPTLAALAKVVRGRPVTESVDQVLRANRDQRGVDEPIPPVPLAEILAFEAVPSLPIYGWLHVATIGSWESILRELFSQIERSGLRAATSKVFVGVVGPDADLSWFPPWVEVVKRDGILTKGENSTLQALWEWSKTAVPGKVWYVHTKGASHPGNRNVIAWRDYLTWANILRWRDRAAALDTHDASGVDYVDLTDNYKWFSELWGALRLIPGTRGFPGNFWWATTDYLASIPLGDNMDAYDRWASEWLVIGTGAPRVQNVHDARVNHYNSLYPRSRYDPASQGSIV